MVGGGPTGTALSPPTHDSHTGLPSTDVARGRDERLRRRCLDLVLVLPELRLQHVPICILQLVHQINPALARTINFRELLLGGEDSTGFGLHLWIDLKERCFGRVVGVAFGVGPPRPLPPR